MRTGVLVQSIRNCNVDEVGDPPGCQPINPTRAWPRESQSDTARSLRAVHSCIFSGSNVRGHMLWPRWLGGFLGDFSVHTGRLGGSWHKTVGAEVQWQCVATVLFRQRTAHQNDSKFPRRKPDASQDPTRNLWSLALFLPMHPRSRIPLYQPRPLRLPRRPLSIQPHTPANQSVPLKRPSHFACLHLFVQKQSTTSRPTPLPTAAPLDSIKSINHSKPRQTVVAQPSKSINQQPNPFPNEIPHGGISQWRP